MVKLPMQITVTRRRHYWSYLPKLIRTCPKAIADGATYVAFGAVYATATKPEAGNVGIK